MKKNCFFRWYEKRYLWFFFLFGWFGFFISICVQIHPQVTLNLPLLILYHLNKCYSTLEPTVKHCTSIFEFPGLYSVNHEFWNFLSNKQLDSWILSSFWSLEPESPMSWRKYVHLYFFRLYFSNIQKIFRYANILAYLEMSNSVAMTDL